MAEHSLRILVLANLPPYVMGGAENQVHRLVEYWLAQGAQVDVAGHRIPDGWLETGGGKIRMHHLRAWPFGGRAGRAAGYFLSLLFLVLRHRGKFDITYCRGLGDGAIAMAILRALRLCSWPLLAVPINAHGNGDAAFIRSVPGWRFLARLLDRQISTLNLINNDIDAELDALGIVKPLRTYIPNGIAIRPPIERHAASNVRRLVWTGRFEAQKGLDLLLLALAACRDEGAQFHLTLWGSGNLQEKLQAQAAQLGIDRNIVFAGACEAHRVRDVLQDADVFVLPSRYEGMSNSALEAMEAGLPVLCTRCGGIDRSVENGAGWVCPPDDLPALQQALMAMLRASDAQILAHGQCARKMVETQFDIRKIAQSNLDLMTRTTNAHARP